MRAHFTLALHYLDARCILAGGRKYKRVWSYTASLN